MKKTNSKARGKKGTPGSAGGKRPARAAPVAAAQPAGPAVAAVPPQSAPRPTPAPPAGAAGRNPPKGGRSSGGGRRTNGTSAPVYQPSDWASPVPANDLETIISMDDRLDTATIDLVRKRLGRERDPMRVRKEVIDALMSQEVQQEYLREIKAVIAMNGGAGHIDSHKYLPNALLYEALRVTARKK